jgi:hypothetical protein
MFLEGLPVGIQKMPIRETTSKLRVCNPYQTVAVRGFTGCNGSVPALPGGVVWG